MLRSSSSTRDSRDLFSHVISYILVYLVRSLVLTWNHRVMNKSLIPREDIKDLPDTPCHPVDSHFPSRTLQKFPIFVVPSF